MLQLPKRDFCRLQILSLLWEGAALSTKILQQMNPYQVEEFVRTKLGEMFGTIFRKQKLLVGYDSKNRPKVHEFDLVSDDMRIIGEIKSGRCISENYRSALVDCFYLSKVKAQTKLMVFTDKKLYEHFKDNSEGLIGNNIRPILILPHV